MISLIDIIDFDEYDNIEYIRKGYSTSHATMNKKVSPYKKYFLKIFNFYCCTSKDQRKILETFCQAKNMKCQYLITYTKFSFSFQSQLNPVFMVKFVSSKTLGEVMSTKSEFKKFSITNIYQCLFAVAEGMCYLHDHLICHGNLCPSNIVIDEVNQFYLIDFNLYPIKKLYIEQENIFNTEYKDPQMIDEEPTFENDIYSYGILICHLFLLLNQIQNENDEKQETLQEFISSKDSRKYSKLPKFLKKMVLSCLNQKTSERTTFKEIIETYKSTKTTQSDQDKLNISEMYEKFSKSLYIMNLANANNLDALNRVGKMYDDDENDKKDPQMSMKYYKKAANKDYSVAQNNYGVLLQENGWKNKPDPKKGAEIIKQSALKGDVHGMFNYGWSLIKGDGVDENYEEGMKYLKNSADLGFLDAQICYSFEILNAENQEKEKIKEGLVYIRKAIEQNKPYAYYVYALVLEEGKNIPKNDKLSMEYYKFAADRGYNDACYKYALGCLKGIGVPKNKEIAIKYFKLGDANGNEKCTKYLKKLEKKEQENSVQPTKEVNEQNNALCFSKHTFKLPVQVSPNKKLISLGNVIYDRQGYHNDKYIFPVGYQFESKYNSIEDPTKEVIYLSNIVDGGDYPIFQVICLDNTNSRFDGYNPSKPWIDAYTAVEVSKQKHGMPVRSIKKINGYLKFGLISKPVTYLIERLPNAEKCVKYKFKNYYIKGHDEPIKGGIQISNVKDLFEEEPEPINEQVLESPAIKEKANDEGAHFNNEQKQKEEDQKEIVKEQQSSLQSIYLTQNDHPVQQNTSLQLNYPHKEVIINNPKQSNQDIDLDQSPEDLIKLGDILAKSDKEKALKCYQEAANKGYINAFLKLAECVHSFEKKLEYYEMGIVNEIPKSFEEWRKLILNEFSNAKDTIEKYNLARRFEKFYDYSDAAYLYSQIKDKINYQICYEKAKKNIENIKDIDQQYIFGVLAENQNEYEIAKEFFEKVSKNANQEQVKQNAINKIAQIEQMQSSSKEPPVKEFNEIDSYVEEAINYFEGRNGKKVDINIALIIFKEASAKGSSVADFYLGNYYKNEYGAECLKRSADSGNAEAQNRYAYYLKEGIGVRKNHNESMKYYKMSADQGNAESMFEYGRDLYEKSMIESDIKEGTSYLKKSAEKMYPDAIYLYSKIIENPNDSKKFYEFSLEHGSKLALKEEEFRTNIVKKINSLQSVQK